MLPLDTTPFSAVSIISAAVDTLTGTLTSVATPILVLATGVFGLHFGWRLLRGFVH